ncbi:MAG: HAMP domain-containing histidine kinase [Muribaculaceae bacterium]|nr:HAMP domain-containing histidine kinase [Muribaculaceae bacterium]
MLSRLIKYITLSLISIFSFSLQAQTIVDSLKTRLAEAETPSDSIIILYNIYDSAPYPEQGKVLEDLYELALRRGEYHTAFDVLKQSSNYYTSNDSMQQVLINRAKSLPDNPEKRSTLIYMNVRAISNQARSLTEEQREAKLRDYLAQYSKSQDYDTYKRIEYLFCLCSYLRLSTEGELLTKYFQELQTLIDNLPARDLALKSLFYTQAANSYLSNEMIPEAVEANKTLLNIIEELERQHHAQGRIYRNYDRPAFICYRRLLRCHNALTHEEVEDYYKKIIPIIDRNPTLQKLSGQSKKPTIYYMMANKRYADAVPLIKEQLKDTINTNEEVLYLVEALLKASDSIGDKESQLKALEMSNELLIKRIGDKAAESYKELQIVYEVNDLKQTNDQLVLENQQIVLNRHKEQLIYAIISLIVLVLLLIVVYVFYHRSKRLTANLSKSNAMIIDERDALKRTQKDLIDARDKAKAANRIKTDFVNNMSHEIRTPLEAIVEYSSLIADCADEDRRGYIKRFADVISLNTDLLLTLVNDVLDLPSLENAKVSVHMVQASVQEICRVALDNVGRHLKPDVKLVFANDGQDDINIHTDPHRVEQVLLNLLMNAAKFTDKGFITLKYALTDDQQKVTFTVTDTGIGIPLGKEEIIFSRFEKLNSTTQGSGLGLYISRLLAGLLKGSLRLDADYRKGARFIFTIPVNG